MVTLDLEAPGIEEDPDAAFDVPVQRSVSDVPPDEELLKACARVLGSWDWKERPGAVVAMPSRRRPQLVTGVGPGAGPAGPAALPGRAVACSTAGRPGSPGGNSAFRLAAVWDRIVVGRRNCASAWPRPVQRRCCSSTTWPTRGGR